MKKLGLMVVGAFFTLATTSALAQTVQTTTKTKTTNTTPRRNGSIVVEGQTVRQKPGQPQQRPGTAARAGQEYSTSPRDGVNSYTDQANNDHQGASAENGEETVTILPKDAATIVPAKTTTTTTKKTTTAKTSSSTKVRP